MPFIKETNFKNPDILVWTLFLSKLNISQKYIKFKDLLVFVPQTRFEGQNKFCPPKLVCKGYLLKWSIITLSSDLDLTLKSASVPNSDTGCLQKINFL